MDSTTFVILYSAVLLCALLAFLVWLINTFGDAVQDSFNTGRFRKDLIAALNNPNPPTPLAWSDVCAMADDHGIELWSANKVLRGLDRDIITGRDKELAKHKAVIIGFLKEYKVTEPFDDLPNDTKLLIDRVRQDLGANLESLYVLANHTKEILRYRDKKNVRQQWYTTGGFLVGLIGVALGVWFYFNPYVAEQPKQVSVSQVAPKEQPVKPDKG
ncbi:hypothetical protein ABOC32_29060 (plasmid) [Pseudomonas sp. WOUb67]|uniref:hypothetical protein n=1 Tax=Pseudomonas sp. WOUb67 TaxID=3161136 RepID=UPI003CEF1873